MISSIRRPASSLSRPRWKEAPVLQLPLPCRQAMGIVSDKARRWISSVTPLVYCQCVHCLNRIWLSGRSICYSILPSEHVQTMLIRECPPLNSNLLCDVLHVNSTLVLVVRETLNITTHTSTRVNLARNAVDVIIPAHCPKACVHDALG